MRVWSWMAALWLGVIVLAPPAGAGDLEAGKKVYVQKCAACHGADGKGNPKMAEMLKVKLPDLTKEAARSDSELTKIISEGRKPMPSFGKSLSKDEIAAVVHHVKGLAEQTAKTK